MDEEWIEEEHLVYVDVGKFIPPKEMEEAEIQFKVIDIDKPVVLVEINGKLFEGSYADSMGTHLFFAEDAPREPENVFDAVPDKPYKFHSKTNKVLEMKRIFVKPNEKEAGDTPDEPAVQQKYVIHQTYQEALDSLLKPGAESLRPVTDALDTRIAKQRAAEEECEMDMD